MIKRIESGLRLLPDPVKGGLKRVAGPFDAVQRLQYRRVHGYGGPIPPARMRARVGAGLSIASFLSTGDEWIDSLESLLQESGTALADVGSVYDWGCGCGRLLLPLSRRLPASTRLIGTDVDPEAIAWCRGAFPGATIMTNGFRPPLPVEDGAAELLISSSVFTHLTEADQDLWLAEVHRVLAPGGLAVITVQGREMHHQMRSGGVVTRSPELMARLAAMPDLDAAGFIFEPYQQTQWNAADFSGITDVYGLAFHDPSYIRSHWAPWLEQLARRNTSVNSWQDLLLFRRV